MKVSFAQAPRNILIVKPSAIGDVVHTLPILNLLRRQFPQAKISWLITPACAGLLDGHSMVDEVILFERKRFAHSWRNLAALRDLVSFAKDLSARQFDLAIDLQGLFRSAWITWQTRAPVRVGFANAREFAWAAYTHRVPIRNLEQHAVERYLTLTESLGCPRSPVEFPFATNDADREFVRDLLGSEEPYALLIPGTNWPTKRWPVERFAELVTPLREHYGLRSIAAGAPNEVELAAKITGARNLAGKTNLRQLTALIEGARLIICNDSGPMHLAAALRKPMVACFGPTNPIRTGPYEQMQSVLRIDIPCSPCYSRKCSHQSCLQWLKTQDVLDQTGSIAH